MKRKAILFLALGIAILTAGCTIVVTPAGEQCSLYYTWEGSQEKYAVWTLYSNGTFKDNYQGRGIWSADGSYFYLAYNNSSYFYQGTVYTGTIYSPDYMNGVMSGPDKYGIEQYGIWEAYRGVHGYRALTPSSEKDPGSKTLSPSGEPIENHENEETNE